MSAQPDRPVKLTLKLTRHADHDPSLICRPALGYGLGEVLEVKDGSDGMSMTPAPRCRRCCEHGIPWSAEDMKKYGTPGWCGWCEDVAGGHADPIPADEPQWLCHHGVGEQPGGSG